MTIGDYRACHDRLHRLGRGGGFLLANELMAIVLAFT
jgi:hypothetical protein